MKYSTRSHTSCHTSTTKWLAGFVQLFEWITYSLRIHWRSDIRRIISNAGNRLRAEGTWIPMTLTQLYRKPNGSLTSWGHINGRTLVNIFEIFGNLTYPLRIGNDVIPLASCYWNRWWGTYIPLRAQICSKNVRMTLTKTTRSRTSWVSIM